MRARYTLMPKGFLIKPINMKIQIVPEKWDKNDSISISSKPVKNIFYYTLSEVRRPKGNTGITQGKNHSLQIMFREAMQSYPPLSSLSAGYLTKPIIFKIVYVLHQPSLLALFSRLALAFTQFE